LADPCQHWIRRVVEGSDALDVKDGILNVLVIEAPTPVEGVSAAAAAETDPFVGLAEAPSSPTGTSERGDGAAARGKDASSETFVLVLLYDKTLAIPADKAKTDTGLCQFLSTDYPLLKDLNAVTVERCDGQVRITPKAIERYVAIIEEGTLKKW
jgi:hypothetical protein